MRLGKENSPANYGDSRAKRPKLNNETIYFKKHARQNSSKMTPLDILSLTLTLTKKETPISKNFCIKPTLPSHHPQMSNTLLAP